MKTVFLSLVAAALCGLSSAYGQALLSFAGGSGTPIRITLGQSVSFTITSTAASNSPPYFVFQNAGNVFGGRTDAIMGGINYQTFVGSMFPVNQAGSGLTAGSIASTDFSLIGSLANLPLGTVVTLVAGTDATPDNFSTAASGGGTFTVFMANSSGTRLSTDGVAVAPEPSTWTLLGIIMVSGGLMVVRRRQVPA